MFILSQVSLKYLKLCREQDITSYSIGVGLVIYTVIYMYFLCYCPDYLGIFNKFLIYIVSIDLLLSGLFSYVSSDKQQYTINLNIEAESNSNNTNIENTKEENVEAESNSNNTNIENTKEENVEESFMEIETFEETSECSSDSDNDSEFESQDESESESEDESENESDNLDIPIIKINDIILDESTQEQLNEEKILEQDVLDEVINQEETVNEVVNTVMNEKQQGDVDEKEQILLDEQLLEKVPRKPRGRKSRKILEETE